jgi:hypothetical protein
MSKHQKLTFTQLDGMAKEGCNEEDFRRAITARHFGNTLAGPIFIIPSERLKFFRSGVWRDIRNLAFSPHLTTKQITKLIEGLDPILKAKDWGEVMRMMDRLSSI